MPNLPIRPTQKRYLGLKEKLYCKFEQRNRMAHRVVNYVNGLIANNPDETQKYFFDMMAADLGLTADEVCAAITKGTYKGITVRVTEEDRRALGFYKVQPKGAAHHQLRRRLTLSAPGSQRLGLK
jgi:hypothetical protein